MGYYFVQIFLPSILCISCAIASFWVKLQIAPARVTLAIATFLTLTQQQSSVNGVLPKVSYVKVPKTIFELSPDMLLGLGLVDDLLLIFRFPYPN